MKIKVVGSIPQFDLLGDHFAQNKPEVFRQLQHEEATRLCFDALSRY